MVVELIGVGNELGCLMQRERQGLFNLFPPLYHGA
jgi:hypothetical protein